MEVMVVVVVIHVTVVMVVTVLMVSVLDGVWFRWSGDEVGGGYW